MDKITVLMAVYNPRQEWFEKQLESINNQTYPDLELLICDDCSTDTTLDKLYETVKSCVTRIPCHILNNQNNLGSTKTFERLTAEGTGEYFAYCDQDDIWEPDKIYKQWSAVTKSNGVMVCTNADRIDSEGNIISRNYMSIPSWFQKKIKSDIAWKTLLVKNYFWGCTLLIKTDVAKRALPFIENMYHDHYLELYASMVGKIVFLDEPLVKYRVHGSNQTGFLKNVECKQDYYMQRICPLVIRFQELLKRKITKEQRRIVEKMLVWAENRERYASGNWWNGICMMRGIKFNVSTTVFELLTMQLPEHLWCWILAELKIKKYSQRK